MIKIYRSIKKIDTATWAAFLFLILFLVLGSTIYTNYGVSWDEREQVDIGRINARYAVRGDPELLDIRNRLYGPSFEIFLYAVRDRSSIEQMYLSRHFWTFISFFISTIFFYFIARRVTKHNIFALIGTGFLVISPRIFANSFYNSKDIPFMALYGASLLTMMWFLDKPNIFRGIFHAFITAAAITIRMPGIIIPVITFIGFTIELISKRIHWKKVMIPGITYLFATIVLIILLWPALWTNPIKEFIAAYELMSKHPNGNTMLFMGKIISSLDTPWYYIPIWITISTPIFYSLLFIPGTVNIVYQTRSWLKNEITILQRDQVLTLFGFFLPLLTVIIMRSNFYNAWRQMFFIYPAFLLIAIIGLNWGWQKTNQWLPRTGSIVTTAGIILLGTLPVCIWMIQNHPYQNLYFNRLAGKDMQTVQQNYMMDFFGLTYREGIEAILEMDKSTNIHMLVETAPGQSAQYILPIDEANRIQAVFPEDEYEYFVGNYYMVKEPYPFANEVYSVEIGNAKILSVYRLNDEEKSLYYNPVENQRPLESTK
jgi:hypothetical protein